MEDKFEVYNSFFSVEDAQQLASLLNDNSIPCKLENNFSNNLGSFYVGESGGAKFVVKIKEKDFEKVDVLLEKQINVNDENIANHYLNDYTTDELKVVLGEYEKWHPNDIAICKEILKKRQIVYTEQDIKEIKEKRLRELSVKKSDNYWVLLGGYLISILGGPQLVLV